METAVFQIELLDGRVFRIFCANKNQKLRVIRTVNKLKDKIKLMSQLQSGIHTEKQWSQISESI